jgi:hypothetical protein
MRDDVDPEIMLWHEILDRSSKQLTAAEFGRVIPPRQPQAHYLNRVRAARLRILETRGFTVEGKQIRSAKVKKTGPPGASR